MQTGQAFSGLLVLALFAVQVSSWNTAVLLEHGNSLVTEKPVEGLAVLEASDENELPFELVVPGLGGDDRHARNQSDITGVTINGAGDSAVFCSTLLFSCLSTAFAVLAFSTCRQSSPAVYRRAVDEENSSAASNGWLDWWDKVWSTSPDEEVRAAGLDGWAFLEFYRMNLRILVQTGPLTVVVLCPLHLFFSKDGDVTDLLSRLDVGHLKGHDHIIWIHAALVWVVVLVVCHNLLQSHEEFLNRRFQWLKDIPWPRATTVMVENIPPQYRSDTALRSYFAGFFGEDAVQSAYVVRRTRRLRQKVELLEATRYEMALARQAWEQVGRPSLPSATESLATSSNMSRAALTLERTIRAREVLAAEVASEQAQIETAVVRHDLSVCSTSGFVTFTTELQQRLARKEQYRRDVTEIVLAMPPDPRDVMYENLAENELGSATRTWVAWSCMLAIFIFWSPVVVLISSWTTLEVVREYVPLLDRWCHETQGLEIALQGIMATLALKLFLAFLPSLLIEIIARFYTLKAGAWAQFYLERWYFAFLFIFVLLVTTLGRGIIITAEQLVRHPTQFLSLVSSTLPTASHFYLNYMIVGWFTMALELTRFSVLLKFFFYKLFYSFGNIAAKQYAEPEDQAACGLGARMALAVLMSSIYLVFSICSPLIALCALVYFALGRMTYGYLLVHVELKKPDLGGEFWALAVQQVMAVLVIFVIMMIGVLTAHTESWSGPPVFAGASLLGVFWAWQRINALAWESLPLDEVVGPGRDMEKRQEANDGKYVQPECDPELLAQDWKDGSELLMSSRSRY